MVGMAATTAAIMVVQDERIIEFRRRERDSAIITRKRGGTPGRKDLECGSFGSREIITQIRSDFFIDLAHPNPDG